MLINEGSLPADVRFQFIGNYYKETSELLKNKSVKGYIEVLPQIEHNEVIKYLLRANVLMLFIESYAGDVILSGKLFELLRAQKIVMAMIPSEGEAAGFVRKYSRHHICAMEDIDGIKEGILRCYTLYKENNAFATQIDEMQQYSREQQTLQFFGKD